jgi:hypothetical protein
MHNNFKRVLAVSLLLFISTLPLNNVYANSGAGSTSKGAINPNCTNPCECAINRVPAGTEGECGGGVTWMMIKQKYKGKDPKTGEKTYEPLHLPGSKWLKGGVEKSKETLTSCKNFEYVFVHMFRNLKNSIGAFSVPNNTANKFYNYDFTNFGAIPDSVDKKLLFNNDGPIYWLYNSYGVIDKSEIDGISDYVEKLRSLIGVEGPRGSSKMITLRNTDIKGYPLSYEFTQKLFKEVQKKEKNNKEAVIHDFRFNKKDPSNESTSDNLGHFCFDFDRYSNKTSTSFQTRTFLDYTTNTQKKKQDGSIEYIKSKKQSVSTDLDGRKSVNITLKEGDSVDLSFRHTAYTNLTQDKLNNVLKHKDFTLKYAESYVGAIKESELDQGELKNPEKWGASKYTNSGNKYTKQDLNSKQDNKPEHDYKLTVKYEDLKGKKNTFCKKVTLDVSAIEIEEAQDGKVTKIKSTSNFKKGKPINVSEICVNVRPDTPPPPSKIDFCAKIADQSEDEGNTGVVSLIRNVSKNQPNGENVYFPSESEIANVNTTDPTQPIRASYSGGIKGVINSPAGFIYARPFDNIQFRHILCYGYHAVTSSEYEDMPGGSRQHQSRHSVDFTISSNPDKHLFGEAAKNHSVAKLYINGSGQIDTTRSDQIDTKRINMAGEYGVVLDSPDDLSDKYNQCGNSLTATYATNISGYALPGKISDCPDSYRGTFNIPPTLKESKVGKTIEQSVSFKNNQVWIGKLTEKQWGNNRICECPEKYDEGRHGLEDPTAYKSRVHRAYKYETDCCEYNDKKCCPGEYSCEKERTCVKEGKKPGEKIIGKCKYWGRCCPEWKGNTWEKKNTFTDEDGTHCPYVYFYPANQKYVGESGVNNDSATAYAQATPHSTTVGVKIPYNFKIDFESGPTPPAANDEIVYAGQILDGITSRIKANPRKNPAVNDDEYTTITPVTHNRLITFTLPVGVTYESYKNNLNTRTVPYYKSARNGLDQELCKEFPNRTGCQVYNLDSQNSNLRLNPDGDYDPKDFHALKLPEVQVPDIEVGDKFCIASAVWPADSHGVPDGELTKYTDQNPALGNNIENGNMGHWRISNVTCRTIAKKPSTQVLGGGIEASSTSSSITSKVPGSNINQFADNNLLRYFGTFTTQNIVSDGQVVGTGSGAAFGYHGEYIGGLGFGSYTSYPGVGNTFNRPFILPGGLSVGSGPNLNEQVYSPLTISNKSSSNLGYSGIEPDYSLTNNLRARYTNHKPNKDQIVNQNNPDNSTDDITSTFFKACTEADRTNPGNHTQGFCLESGAKYIKPTGGEVNIGSKDNNQHAANITLPTPPDSRKGYNNNTYIIDATSQDEDGNRVLRINSNIIVPSTKQNGQFYSGPESVPQLLIFADKIEIASKVTRIDAWLIARSDINTCAEFDEDKTKAAKNVVQAEFRADSPLCSKHLEINGPVFSDEGQLKLNRTAGTYEHAFASQSNYTSAAPNPSLYKNYYRTHVQSWPNNPQFSFNNIGTITPAELFHLRSDSYLWAFSQAQRLTQVHVVYRREMPVRY